MLVVCNGMIRSGSTLQYNIVRSLVHNCKVGLSHGYLGTDNLGASGKQLLAWGLDGQYHVIKMHGLHETAKEMTASGKMRICYVYRDIRDVALSAKIKWKYDVDSLLKALDQAISVYYSVLGLEGVLIQRYEKVIRDLYLSTEEVARFLGLCAPEEMIKEISEELSLEKAVELAATISRSPIIKGKVIARRLTKRVLGQKLATRVRQLFPFGRVFDRQTLFHPDHVSKNLGAVGTWRNDLSGKEAEMITRRYETWLTEVGYF
jgi:hypothetical protein